MLKDFAIVKDVIVKRVWEMSGFSESFLFDFYICSIYLFVCDASQGPGVLP